MTYLTKSSDGEGVGATTLNMGKFRVQKLAKLVVELCPSSSRKQQRYFTYKLVDNSYRTG